MGIISVITLSVKLKVPLSSISKSYQSQSVKGFHSSSLVFPVNKYHL
jgi:hypothetical protein